MNYRKTLKLTSAVFLAGIIVVLIYTIVTSFPQLVDDGFLLQQAVVIDTNTQIALTENSEGQRRLELVNRDGNKLRILSEQNIIGYKLSLDHRLIAYSVSSQVSEENPFPKLSIWIYNLENHKSEILLDAVAEEAIFSFNEMSNYLAIATSTELIAVDLSNKNKIDLIKYETIDTQSDIAFVPEPYWQKDEIIIMVKEPTGKDVASATYKVNIFTKQKTLIGKTFTQPI